MEKDIRDQLIKLARLRTTWSYSQLNQQLQLNLDFSNQMDRNLIGDWLDDVSRNELDKNRPPLSALITHQNGKREQGDGFYKMCADYEDRTWEELKKDKKWENSLIADCYEFWLNPKNHKNFKSDF